MQQGPQYQGGYGPPPGWQPPPKKGMGVLGWLGIGALVCFGGCFAMCAAGAKGVADKQTSEKKAFDQEAAVSVTADELIAAYKSNEIAADGKYKKKKLRVSGRLASIDSGLGDEPVLQLGTGMFPHVGARGVGKAEAAALTKDKVITVECKGDGEVGGMPQLSDCSLL